MTETDAKQSYARRPVLVTGADGFIGSHLVEALARAGAKVAALAQYNSFGTNGWLDEIEESVLSKVTVHRGDVRDRSHMLAIAQDQDVIFHLAALISVPYSFDAGESFVDTNIHGTMNILEAARRHGTPRVICTSTSEVYGTAEVVPISEQHRLHAQSPYAASKIGADMMAQAYALTYGLPVILLRPFNTFGPRQSERAVISNLIRQVLDPDCAEIRLGNLAPRRDFNYVEDIAAAFVATGSAELASGEPYNVGSGSAISIGELCEHVRRITGVNKPVVQDPQRLRPEDAEVMELVADAARFRAASGWRPTIGFETGLERTIGWWRERIESGKVRRSSDYVV
jgi:UDP-glucose 4-epimerase